MGFIVNNTTFFNLLDLIAPHSCRGCGQLGEVLCERCKKHIILSQNNICPNCKKPTDNHFCQNCEDFPPIFYIGPRDNLLAKLIHDFKYKSTRTIGFKFADMLNELLPKDLSNIVIVSLPTSTKHVRERGFDHTLLIAKHLAKLRHWQIKKVLVRSKNTVQVGNDKKTREIQASNAYTVNRRIKIDSSYTYILLDDVWTTGASMKSAIKKLQQAGAKNIIAVLLAVNRLD